ncbi:hypothetical protein K438DRAFT_1749079 [Mycena galopus ATCC 62051]|nr:hypothetical protein K438DRAFT_1749079 [Mycena galopus ATCC 62051]
MTLSTLFLRRTPDGDTGLLPPGHYTYHLTSGEVRYAVCTSFRAWTAPGTLPSYWKIDAMGLDDTRTWSPQTTYSTADKAPDGQCAVTGDISRLEYCHLVPKAEDTWWIRNAMRIRTTNPRGINAPPNCPALRADLNTLGMDQGHFVLAPYDGKADLTTLAKDPSVVTIREPELDGAKSPAKRKRTMKDADRDEQGGSTRRDEQDGSTGRDEQNGSAGGGDQKQHQDRGGADEGLQISDDDSPQESDDEEPSLDLYNWTEHDLEMTEQMDAVLHGRPLGELQCNECLFLGQLTAARDRTLRGGIRHVPGLF